jgi:hypothetical protein
LRAVADWLDLSPDAAEHLITGTRADEVPGPPLKESLACRRVSGDFLQQPEVLSGEPAAHKKDAVDVPDRRVVGVVDCGNEKEASAYGFLDPPDRAPGNMRQIQVLVGVLRPGIGAYHEFEKYGSAT